MTVTPEPQRLTGFIMPVGNGAVGKTSVARVLDMVSRGRAIDWDVLQRIRRTNNLEFEYITTYQTFGERQHAVTLQFLVPPGQKQSEGDQTGRSFEQVIAIYQSVIRRMDVILFTYDLENHESFHDLAYWVDSAAKLMDDATHFILLGTHLDLADYTEVSREEIKEGLEYLRKEVLMLRPTWTGKCTQLEISCLSGENMDILLRYLAGSVISAQQMRG
jgi:GTPase SAR1 family protein